MRREGNGEKHRGMKMGREEGKDQNNGECVE